MKLLIRGGRTADLDLVESTLVDLAQDVPQLEALVNSVVALHGRNRVCSDSFDEEDASATDEGGDWPVVGDGTPPPSGPRTHWTPRGRSHARHHVSKSEGGAPSAATAAAAATSADRLRRGAGSGFRQPDALPRSVSSDVDEHADVGRGMSLLDQRLSQVTRGAAAAPPPKVRMKRRITRPRNRRSFLHLIRLNYLVSGRTDEVWLRWWS